MDSLNNILDISNVSINFTDPYWIKNKLVSILQEEISLIWIIFGTIGNLLSLLVLCRKKMRIHSTFTYLTLLAFCDTLVLYFGLLRDYLVNKYQINIYGDYFCKFHVFSFYFMLHMASWLLVAVNIDRLIAASFLGLSKKWCTPRIALIVSLCIGIILAVLNSHFIFFVDSEPKFHRVNTISSNSLIENNQNLHNPSEYDTKSILAVNHYSYRLCFIKQNYPTYKYFFTNVFTWIDASAQVILPFIIMVVCNVNIIHKVLLTKNKTNGKNLKRLRKIKGMCIMIVSVSVIFFVLEAPVLIFICLEQGQLIQSNWKLIDFVWTIMNLMMYTNHVINFLSYCMTGTKFRRELLRLLYVHRIFKFLPYFNLIPQHSKNYTTIPIRKNNNQNTTILKKNNTNVNTNIDKEKILDGCCIGNCRPGKNENELFNQEKKEILIGDKNMVSLTNLIFEKKKNLGASSSSLNQNTSQFEDEAPNPTHNKLNNDDSKNNKPVESINKENDLVKDKTGMKNFVKEFYRKNRKIFKNGEINLYIKKNSNCDAGIEFNLEDDEI